MRTAIYTTTLLLALSATVLAQDNKEKPQTIVKVTQNIVMLQDQGGNIGLSIGEDGIFMIDDQFERNITVTQATIKGLDPRPVHFLVNTHHHGDHTGGNAAMANTGTILFAHQNVRKRLNEMITSDKKPLSPQALPMITFDDDMTFHYNGDQIFVFHVHNAHTDGDAMVYFMNSNVIHTGDVFFKGRYPYIDLKSGGDVLGYIKALDKMILLTNEDTKVIPGHGDLATIDDVIFTRDMLRELHTQVAAMHAKGKTQKEIISNRKITKKYDTLGYGDGFISTERMLQTMYNDVLLTVSDK